MLFALMISVLSVQVPTPVAPSPLTADLFVEVVDSISATLPGVTVAVIPRANRKKHHMVTTDKDGIARFSLPADAEYKIQATLVGFKKGRVKSVRISEESARVQIRLALSKPPTIITHTGW